MEQMLRQILDGQQQIITRIDKIDTEVSGIKVDMTDMKTDISGMKIDMATMNTDITDMKADITGMKTDITGMKNDMVAMKTDITGMKTDMATMNTDITDMKLDMATMNTEITAMKVDMATKTQQDENTQVIKAILHSIETANAELNGLKLTTLNKEALIHLATKEDVAETNDHLMALNERLFHQEAAISHLKAVK